jgi:tetratricopeptide (TPR) repeat protein
MRTIIICLLSAGLTMAQQHDHTVSAEKPVELYSGLGAWHHPIHTSNPEAQEFFDQGLALMYGFNRYEALRSFRKAAELDPAAAMPHWGMAMAQGPYINLDGDSSYDMKASCAAAEAGLKLTGAPEREQAYLHAAAQRCPDYKKPEAYVDAMRALAARWPDDLDALTLYAESLMVPVRWHWYAADGTPGAGVPEAERALEEVLRRWPDHPGANHLYIHVVESSHTPERAIPSAQRLMGIMPWAGHMVHMPGHIWLVLGDYEMAATVNERAAAVDREYLSRTQVTEGGYGPYYVHNLHFIAYARWMQGRMADGLHAADEMSAAMAPMVEAMPEMADSFNSVTIYGRVRFHDWDGILKAPQPKDSLHMSVATWHYARALAFAARGDRAAAQREQAALDSIRTGLPADAPAGLNKAKDVLALALETVAARLAATPADAVPHWQRAVAMQDALSYDEPPDWYYPVRESLGAALLLAGKPAEAESVFREGVKRSPRNGRMLFGLMESLRAQGKDEDAGWVKREFEAAWAKADVKLKLEEM